MFHFWDQLMIKRKNKIFEKGKCSELLSNSMQLVTYLQQEQFIGK